VRRRRDNPRPGRAQWFDGHPRLSVPWRSGASWG
jgi:hypothetical protein